MPLPLDAMLSLAGLALAYLMKSGTVLMFNARAFSAFITITFDLTIWHGLYAPKGTPPAVLTALNEGLKKALKDPDFIKKQESLGAVVVTDKRVEPAAHKAFVASEIAKLKVVIDAAKQYAD